MKILKAKNNKGFTLIEMLVAVTLFSVVLVISMGSIMTIVDVSRKSQSLTIVMNDLGFVFESISRSVKTGKILTEVGDYSEIEVTNQDGAGVTYSFANGAIQKNDVNMTSSQIHVDNLRFRIFNDSTNRQPRLLVTVSGTASTSPTISSKFSIQTTISQSELNVANFSAPND